MVQDPKERTGAAGEPGSVPGRVPDPVYPDVDPVGVVQGPPEARDPPGTSWGPTWNEGCTSMEQERQQLHGTGRTGPQVDQQERLEDQEPWSRAYEGQGWSGNQLGAQEPQKSPKLAGVTSRCIPM